jgi:zinc protease
MPQLPGIVHWVKKDDVELPRIYLAWHSPALYAPGDAELDLWSSVLTDGKTSRLFQPLVYEQKVAKEVAAFQASEKLSSSFVIMATAAPGVSIEKLQSALEEALKKALATPPTERELERAQNAFKKGFYQRIEGVDSRASLLANYYLHTGRADFLGEDLGRYVNATATTVHEAARRYMDPQRFVRLDFVPGERSAPVDKLPLVPAATAPATAAPQAKPEPATTAPKTQSSTTQGAAK